MYQWPPLDISTGGGRVGPQVNKFEQFSSDDLQMSVVGRRVGAPGLEGGRVREA